MSDETKSNRRTVIVGVAQITTPAATLPGQEPLIAWEQAVRAAAAADAGITPEALRGVDRLKVLDCMSWRYDDPPTRLADRLDITAAQGDYLKPSGTSGHDAVHQAKADIDAGRSEMAIIVGGEALATLKWYRKQHQIPDWSHPSKTEGQFVLDDHQHPDEVAVGLTADVGAIYSFAMFDIARRARLGMSPADYRKANSALFSAMSRIAADNPDAWFREHKSEAFINTPSPENRPISYPYTKHSVAFLEVDMAAALIVMSEDKARALGIPAEKWVYPWSAALLHDPVYIAVRPDLSQSPALTMAVGAVLKAHDITARDLDLIDLYSCFPAAVNFAQDALGTALPGDKITQTGGLPYAGGPGSSYMLTSLVKVVQGLRKREDGIALVGGVGMLMSDHAYGLYGRQRPDLSAPPIDEAALQAKLDRMPQANIVTAPEEGSATVAAYTVMYDRAGNPSHGAAICDLPDGNRIYASIDQSLLEKAINEEIVGQTFRLSRAPEARIGTLLPV